jgi:aspartyl/asparaginyl-tRNA synthetase
MNKTLARKSLLLLSSPPLNSRINIFKVLKSTSAVKDALSLDKVGQKFDLQGWVKSARIQKINTFIDLDDGLTIGGQRLQIVAKTEQVPSELTYHSAISVSGKLRKSDHPGQEVELEAENIEVVSSVNLDDYPFQPRKRYEDELPRTFPQYRHSGQILVSNFPAFLMWALKALQSWLLSKVKKLC